MLQIERSNDSKVIVQSVASGVASIMSEQVNFTGSKGSVTILTGQSTIVDKTADLTHTATTNFPDGEDVTNAEWKEVAAYDQSEVAAFYGTLMRAIANVPNETGSLDSFNVKRTSAATRAVIGKPNIFREGSRWITYDLIKKVNAAFNFYSSCRINMFKLLVDRLGPVQSGKRGTFFELFELIENSGLAGYAAIRITVEHALDDLMKFPELYPQLRIANDAFGHIQAETVTYKAYAKAMFQERWVPAKPEDIAQLVGVCQIMAGYCVPSMATYVAGKATDNQKTKARRLMEARGFAVAESETVTQEVANDLDEAANVPLP